MIKEKIIFWPLLAVFMGIVIFGLTSHSKRKEATKDLLKEIELATKKSMIKKKGSRDKQKIADVKTTDTLENYKLLIKRSPFFRVSDETKVIKTKKVISVKEPEPKKAILKYKGKVMMGSKVMVVIEDQGTGKSFFVQEGDMVGDFLVVTIDEKEVSLKKKGGEEIVLSAAKKEEPKKETEEEKDTGEVK